MEWDNDILDLFDLIGILQVDNGAITPLDESGSPFLDGNGNTLQLHRTRYAGEDGNSGKADMDSDFREILNREFQKSGWPDLMLFKKGLESDVEQKINDYCKNTGLKKQDPKIIYTGKLFVEWLRKESKLDPLFPTNYNNAQLKTIYEFATNEKLIKCSEETWLYWFTGEGTPQPKIKWIKKWGQNPNKAMLMAFAEKLNPNILPNQIKAVFDVEVDSNNSNKNKSKGNKTSYPILNKIFKNL